MIMVDLVERRSQVRVRTQALPSQTGVEKL